MEKEIVAPMEDIRSTSDGRLNGTKEAWIAMCLCALKPRTPYSLSAKMNISLTKTYGILASLVELGHVYKTTRSRVVHYSTTIDPSEWLLLVEKWPDLLSFSEIRTKHNTILAVEAARGGI